MSYTRVLGIALALALLPGSLLADTVKLNPQHPDHYVVKKGDTLWDIAGRFLQNPWDWPHIWHANPRINDPNLIYPGDELTLTYRNGRPVVYRSRRGLPTVKLSPHVRAEPLGRDAIPTIPIEAIQPFLSRPRVVSKEEYDDAPYVVSVGKERLVAGPGARVYVRGLGASPQSTYAIYRLGNPLREPPTDGASYASASNASMTRKVAFGSASDGATDTTVDSGRVLGYEALQVGEAVLRRGGDPATLVVTSGEREVLPGDRLFAPGADDVHQSFSPHAPPKPVAGAIISLIEGVSQVGQHQVVVLNLGRRDGIDRGTVLAVYQRGAQVRDRFAQERPHHGPTPSVWDSIPPGNPHPQNFFEEGAENAIRAGKTVGTVFADAAKDWASPFVPEDEKAQKVTLPEQRAGVLMVFRPFAHVSYALVMKATRSIHIDDLVRNP